MEEKTDKKIDFPLVFKVHDFTPSMRGQGKRVKGMIKGAMSCRIGKSAEIDIAKTFHLTEKSDIEDIECLNQWSFCSYRIEREKGKSHFDAMGVVYEEQEKLERWDNY